jgi:hypothetical protein
VALRNHWVLGGNDITLNTGQVSQTVLTVPAGATLKKVMINNNMWYGRQDNTTFSNACPNPQWACTILINNTLYPNRYIFRTQRRIPFTAFTHYNVNALTTHYSQLFHAGDNELGVNQSVSYNGPGAPALPVTFTVVQNNPEGAGLGNSVSMRVQFICWILYYQ